MTTFISSLTDTMYYFSSILSLLFLSFSHTWSIFAFSHPAQQGQQLAAITHTQTQRVVSLPEAIKLSLGFGVIRNCGSPTFHGKRRLLHRMNSVSHSTLEMCVCVCVWFFTFSRSQNVSVAESTDEDNSFETLEGQGAGAQVLHCDVPHLHTNIDIATVNIQCHCQLMKVIVSYTDLKAGHVQRGRHLSVSVTAFFSDHCYTRQCCSWTTTKHRDLWSIQKLSTLVLIPDNHKKMLYTATPMLR